MSEPVSSSAATVDRENPWPGLASFTEDLSGFFYGRDEEIRTLTRQLERKALTVLFGQSGLGKSSLLQAGVFPRLRATNYLPIYLRLDHAEGAPTPSEQVKKMVTAAAQGAGKWTKPGTAKPGETLWEFFHHRDDQLVDGRGKTIVPVLVFDQFEELFTLGAAVGVQRDRAVAFMSELAELVENRPSEALVERLDKSSEEMDVFDFGRTDYRVCISLREDYLPHLEGLKTIMPALMENRMRLTRMTGTQALEAVIKPGGALVTEEVARAIVEFVAGARGGSVERLAELDVEPPLLSVICREFNERRRALGHAQISADLVSGNRREILHDFYDRSVRDLPEGMRLFVEDRLLTKSGFRDNLALETALEEPGVAKPLIDTLVSRRLLRIEDRLGVQRVELTHDVLAEVIRASRDARQQRHALAAEARRSRRLRFLIAGLTAAVFALSVGAVFGIRAQRVGAKRASQTDLLLASRVFEEGKTTDGLAYLVRAARRDPENGIIAPRILTTLVNHNFLLPLGQPVSVPSPVISTQFSADGKWVTTVGKDSIFRTLDANDLHVLREFRFAEPMRQYSRVAAKAPVVAFISKTRGILVHDLNTGELRAPPLWPAGVPYLEEGLVFSLSDDGRSIAGALGDRVWLWDAVTGRLVATLATTTARHMFSPDGQLLATAAGRDDAARSRIYRVADGVQVAGPFGLENVGSPTAARFTPDSKSWFLRYPPGGQLFDIATGKATGPWLELPAWSNNYLFTRDGRRLIVTGDRGVHVIELATGRLAYPPLVHGGPVYFPQLSNDERVLLTNCVDGVTRLWDVESGRLIAEPTLQQDDFSPAALAPDASRVVQFTTDAHAYQLLLGRGAAQPFVLPSPAAFVVRASMVAGPPNRIERFLIDRIEETEVASGRETTRSRAYPGNRRLTTGSNVRTVVSPDRRSIIARFIGQRNTWYHMRRSADGSLSEPVELENAPVAGAATFSFHPTEPFAVLGNGNNVLVWNLDTGKLAYTFTAASPVLATDNRPRFSPDGKRLGYFNNAGHVLHVLDFPSGHERFSLQAGDADHYMSSWRFAPDGKHLVTGDNWGGVQFYNAADGQLIFDLQRHRDQAQIADFSADGKLMVTKALDGTAQVWDIARHAPVGSLMRHSGAVLSAVFGPDGQRVATASSEDRVRLWDAASGQPLTEPLRDEGNSRLEGLEFSPDGRFLLSYHADRAIYRIHALPPANGGSAPPGWLLRLATAAASKRLTDDGEFQSAADETARLDEIRREIAALPDHAPYADWARWFLADRTTRPIAPGFTVTSGELGNPQLLAELLEQDAQLRNRRSFVQAEAVERQILELVRIRDGDESPTLIPPGMNLVRTFLAVGKFSEAEQLVREIISYRDDGQGGIAGYRTGTLLGIALTGLKRHAEAEAALLAAQALMDARTEPSREERIETARALAQLYTAMGQLEKAADWTRRAAGEGATPGVPKQ